ncbi:uncharacterized protein ATNIH1004_001976 [Aspergillus tanneri]|uniref:Uncharacterized protein n=1 Tax=Aspergillus tanneri TaxID=1220188 RepID=A0A5M9M7R6_9EURO|nr:uncharacterized protein ATNIH1004_001976 [Aspergillus tanneri]KAA8641374.1 hypothetical protein ATNIH1004_001976 [Aspergillus tanneri]
MDEEDTSHALNHTTGAPWSPVADPFAPCAIIAAIFDVGLELFRNPNWQNVSSNFYPRILPASSKTSSFSYSWVVQMPYDAVPSQRYVTMTFTIN